MTFISKPSDTELLNIDDYFTTIYEKVFENYRYSKPGAWDLNVTDVNYREFSDRENEQLGNLNIFLKFVDTYLLNVDIDEINSLDNLKKYKKALEFIINKFEWLVGYYLTFIGDETCDEIRKIYAKPTKINPKPNKIKKAQFYANANTRCRFKARFEPRIYSAQKVLDKILEKLMKQTLQ